jgi:very-short-patch-repair endonuclease
MKIHNRSYLRERRKLLRSNLSPAEAFQWTHLKKKQLGGRKFRRRHSILDYIVDFYCAREKLIVELDGDVHMNPKAIEYDRQRTYVLKSYGFRILRFENKMVFDNLPSVILTIQSEFLD